MKIFEEMFLECYRFSSEDVICTSTSFDGEWDSTVGGSKIKSDNEVQESDPYRE